jgi:hypothetical protein
MLFMAGCNFQKAQLLQDELLVARQQGGTTAQQLQNLAELQKMKDNVSRLFG